MLSSTFVDELGYLPLDQQTSEWGNTLHNTTIATAIADRLVENSEIILLGGESLRKANKGQPPTE